MRRALLGFAAGVASTVVLVWAQIIAWGLHADFYEDDPPVRVLGLLDDWQQLADRDDDGSN